MAQASSPSISRRWDEEERSLVAVIRAVVRLVRESNKACAVNLWSDIPSLARI